MLEKWWSKKYRLPSNHELFTSRTLFDLLVEFYDDYYDKNPLEAHRNKDGEIQFRDTGDPVVDHWEQLIADGKTPNFSEVLSPEALARLKKSYKNEEPSVIINSKGPADDVSVTEDTWSASLFSDED